MRMIKITWLYRIKKSWLSPAGFTVGFYSPVGIWHTESHHIDQDAAAARVRWLNGGRAPFSIEQPDPEPCGKDAAGRVLKVLNDESRPEHEGPFGGLTAEQVGARVEGLSLGSVMAALEQLQLAGAACRHAQTRCWHSTGVETLDDGADGVVDVEPAA